MCHVCALGLKTTNRNKAANAALHDTVHRRYQGILYFQHVIQFDGMLINVISYTLVSRIFERIFTEPKNSQNSYVIISYNDFHPNRTVCVGSININ